MTAIPTQVRERPFLSIVTRHLTTRPGLFTDHLQSLTEQTVHDYEHVLILDEVGVGVAEANLLLTKADPQGLYTLILDDDDRLYGPDVIEILKLEVETADWPDLVIFRGDHGPGIGILPDDVDWRVRPVRHRTGTFCYIARTELWKEHVTAVAGTYDGDFNILDSLWNAAETVLWLDEVLTQVQQIGYGRAESEVPLTAHRLNSARARYAPPETRRIRSGLTRVEESRAKLVQKRHVDEHLVIQAAQEEAGRLAAHTQTTLDLGVQLRAQEQAQRQADALREERVNSDLFRQERLYMEGQRKRSTAAKNRRANEDVKQDSGTVGVVAPTSSLETQVNPPQGRNGPATQRVSVIFPTVGRPQQAVSQVRELLASGNETLEVEVIAVVDNDTATRQALIQLQEPRLTVLTAPTRQGIVGALNQGLEAASGDVLIVASDDWDFPKGWLQKALAPLSATQDFVAFLDQNYKSRAATEEFAIGFLTTRQHLDEVQGGVLAHPEYRYWSWNVEASVKARRAGRYTVADVGPFVVHHPDLGNAGMDETYRAAIPGHLSDQATYNRRRGSLL